MAVPSVAKNRSSPRRLVESIAAEPVLDGALQFGEDQLRPFEVEIVEQLGRAFGGGGVDVGNGLGGQDDPADRLAA